MVASIKDPVSYEYLYQILERQNLNITKAKALALVGVNLDYSEYHTSLLSEYWSALFDLLEQAQTNQEEIMMIVSRLIPSTTIQGCTSNS